MEPIVIESRDGEMIEIIIDNDAARPRIWITDPHDLVEEQVEIIVNGSEYLPTPR